MLDRLYWGEEPLARRSATRSSSSSRTCATCPPTRFDGVDGVINLAGLSNDPTAEYDPEANWQMNALATEALGAALRRARHRALRVRLLVLALRRAAARHARRGRRRSQPRGAYATSKRYGEEALLELAGEGLCPVILRNGTVYGCSPRMRFDLVVNTFVKDALLNGRLLLHGGGWMWRPLVDVRDAADAMIARLEAPAEKVRGEIFNVLHSNYQIRELAMLVAGLGAAPRPPASTLEEAPAPALSRDYECSNAKLSTTLGFIPRHSVVEAVTDLLVRLADADSSALTDPRHYNIRWLELMHELKPRLERFETVL